MFSFYIWKCTKKQISSLLRFLSTDANGSLTEESELSKSLIRTMGAARIFSRGGQKNFAYKITFKILRIFSRIVLVLWVPILKPRWRHRVCWKSLYQALINYDDGILADYLLADHLLDSRSSARRDKLSRWSLESRKSFAHEELATGYWCLGNKFWLLVYKQTAIGAKYCFTLKWSKSIILHSNKFLVNLDRFHLQQAGWWILGPVS